MLGLQLDIKWRFDMVYPQTYNASIGDSFLSAKLVSFKLLILLITVTLLWTGSFLHDLDFGSDEHNSHNHFTAHHHDHVNHHDVITKSSVSDIDLTYDSHFHRPAATSHSISAQPDEQAKQVANLPVIEPSEKLLYLRTLANFQRPPPFIARHSRIKLYLLNKSLLI